MNKMTVWRERLDVTSNWAILLSIGLTTFTLGSIDVPHYTLLLGLALIAISIVIEGRRYRHLHHSKWRLYLLELGLFSELLEPDVAAEDSSWRRHLAEDLRQPEFPLTLLTAIRARLRRNYLMLIYFVTAVWLVKLFIHPHSPASLDEFIQRLGVGGLVPPWFVLITAPAFIVTATVLGLTCRSAEVLEDWQRWRCRGIPRYGNPICRTEPEPLPELAEHPPSD